MGHRRQGSDGAQPLVVGAPTQVHFDGSILQAQPDSIPRGRAVGGEQDGRAKAQAKAVLARPGGLARPACDKPPPMTPPRVAGISLAPTLDPEHGGERPGAGAAPAAGAACGGAKPAGRHSQTHLAIGAKAAAPAPVALAGGEMAKLLIAEGRSIQRAAPGVPACSTGPLEVTLGRGPEEEQEVDPRILAYQEIHGSQGGDDGPGSVCSTPARMTMQSLTRIDSGANGPFGPLSPHPLSPSILTVCGSADDFEFAVPGEAGRRSIFESDGAYCLRSCESPRLPS